MKFQQAYLDSVYWNLSRLLCEDILFKACSFRSLRAFRKVSRHETIVSSNETRVSCLETSLKIWRKMQRRCMGKADMSDVFTK